MIDCQLPSSTDNSATIATDAPSIDTSNRTHCTHCQETGDNQIYWGIQLDQDLLETLISIYPDWFNGYSLNLPTMTDNSNALYQLSTPSPPKSEVDENSLKNSMDKNKESLKVKLMLRRPITQLIDQGIMPPLKTPPAFHEQRQKLERAKTGDLLKSKIQRRPARQQLIQQHILEDTTVDPSLQERQRLLKKARLQDDLNERLCHRPGPLELIKGNILKTDEPLAQAIKEGQLTFRNTSEGELRKHPGPMFFYEEDSGSDGALSPSQESPLNIQGIPSVSSSDNQRVILSSPISLTTPTSSISDIRSPLSSLSSPAGSIGSPPTTFATAISTSFGIVPTSTSLLTSTATTTSQPSAPIQARPIQTTCPIKQEAGGGKARKKSKSKSQPKARTIKFHEYKGPPNAQKISNANSLLNNSESTYDLLLQQQQLFLQWQLEWQHKYPQILLPATQKNPGMECTPVTALPGTLATSISTNTMSNSSNSSTIPATPAPQSRQSSPPVVESGPGSPIVRTISKLEDLKVNDLKAELKKRNLPVSGPKPQLIERLKPFSDEVMQPLTSTATTVPSPAFVEFNNAMASPPPNFPISTSPMAATQDDATMTTISSLSSPPPMSPLDAPMDTSDIGIVMESVDSSGKQSPPVSEEHLKQQHKRIQELQNELQRSQLQLQKQQTILQQQVKQQLSPGTPQVTTSGGSVGSNTTKMLQQHLQQKIQQQQHQQRQKLLQQQQQLIQQQQLQQQQLQQQSKQLVQHQVSAEDIAKQLQQQPQAVQIPIMSTNTAGNIAITSAPMSLATTLAGQLLIGQNVLTTANIPFVALANADHINIVDNSNNIPVAKTIRANSLPNGLGQVRTDSLNFGTAAQPAAQIQRTTTDPQFVITRPPPAYNEATKQTVNEKVATEGEKKKSQAVEDVLEILIRNGELPASVVQDPTTPNKSSSEPPTFPTSPSSPDAAAQSVKSEPDDVINNCLSSFLNSDSGNQRETNSFALDLELELEGLESMDLTNMANDDQTSQIPPPSSTSAAEANAEVDVDMDWLDSIISTPLPATTAPAQTTNISGGFNSFNMNNNNENNHDPMLSVTSALHNPLDLFSLNDMDFKTSADLNTALSWDRLDFAA